MARCVTPFRQPRGSPRTMHEIQRLNDGYERLADCRVGSASGRPLAQVSEIRSGELAQCACRSEKRQPGWPTRVRTTGIRLQSSARTSPRGVHTAISPGRDQLILDLTRLQSSNGYWVEPPSADGRASHRWWGVAVHPPRPARRATNCDEFRACQSSAPPHIVYVLEALVHQTECSPQKSQPGTM